jgi:hypothetical protein
MALLLRIRVMTVKILNWFRRRSELQAIARAEGIRRRQETDKLLKQQALQKDTQDAA